MVIQVAWKLAADFLTMLGCCRSLAVLGRMPCSICMHAPVGIFASTYVSPRARSPASYQWQQVSRPACLLLTFVLGLYMRKVTVAGLQSSKSACNQVATISSPSLMTTLLTDIVTQVEYQAIICLHPGLHVRCAGCIQELTLYGFRCQGYFSPVYVSIRLEPAMFCNLRRLCLKSKGHVQVHIPAAVHLASLHIFAELLSLTFENAMVSCANLIDVNVLHCTTIGPTVIELLKGPLAEKGVCVRQITRHHDIHLHQHTLRLVTSMPPSPHGDSHDLQMQLDIFEGTVHNCSCTMCWTCMKR